MKFEVRISRRAERDIAEAALWWAENRSAEQAERWYDSIYPAIQSLETMPGRCSVAPEDELHEGDVRNLLFGIGRRPTHRVIFTIEGNKVFVLGVRHVARDVEDC